MPTPRAGQHTAGVLAALDDKGILADAGLKPDGGGWQGEPGSSLFKGYVVVYPGAGQTQGLELGTIGDPHAALRYLAQLTCVGATAAQAAEVLDDARDALIGQRIPVAGRVTQPAYTTAGFNVPLQRDDQIRPAEWYVITQIEFKSDPAG